MTSKLSSWAPRSTQRSFLNILVWIPQNFLFYMFIRSVCPYIYCLLFRQLSNDPHPWFDIPSGRVPAWGHYWDDQVEQNCSLIWMYRTLSSQTQTHTSLCRNYGFSLAGIVLRVRIVAPHGRKAFGRVATQGLKRRRRSWNTKRAGPVMRALFRAGKVIQSTCVSQVCKTAAWLINGLYEFVCCL